MNSIRQESELTCMDTGKSRNEVISDNDQLQIDIPSSLGCPIANPFETKHVKNGILYFSCEHALLKAGTIPLMGNTFHPLAEARTLGVVLTFTLSFTPHIQQPCELSCQDLPIFLLLSLFIAATTPIFLCCYSSFLNGFQLLKIPCDKPFSTKDSE